MDAKTKSLIDYIHEYHTTDDFDKEEQICKDSREFISNYCTDEDFSNSIDIFLTRTKSNAFDTLIDIEELLKKQVDFELLKKQMNLELSKKQTNLNLLNEKINNVDKLLSKKVFGLFNKTNNDKLINEYNILINEYNELMNEYNTSMDEYNTLVTKDNTSLDEAKYLISTKLEDDWIYYSDLLRNKWLYKVAPGFSELDYSIPVNILYYPTLIAEYNDEHYDIYENPIKFNISFGTRVESYINEDTGEEEFNEYNRYLLSMETYNSSTPLYLNNEEKYEYLKLCLDYINQINNKKIYAHRNILNAIHFSIFIFEDNIKTSKYVNRFFLLKQLLGYTHQLDKYLHRKEKIIKNELNTIELGLTGEQIVNNHLKMYDDEFINLSNIRLEVEGNSIENDNILLTPYGIFILEVKNLGSSGSYSLKISKDGKWSKVFKNGQSESVEYHASLQNERHIRYLQRYINNKLNRTIDDENYIRVNGIVIISNNEVDIENESEQPIFRISEIYRQISKHNIVFKMNELLYLKDIILKEALEPKKYIVPDYLSELKDNIEVFDNYLNSFDIPLPVLKLPLIWYTKYIEIFEKLKQFENEYNCSLINENSLFSTNNKITIESLVEALSPHMENL